MNLIWFLCWFSDSIIDGFARAVLAFAELVGCFNAVISADIAFDYTADSSVSFTIIFFLMRFLPIIHLLLRLICQNASDFAVNFLLVLSIDFPKIRGVLWLRFEINLQLFVEIERFERVQNRQICVFICQTALNVHDIRFFDRRIRAQLD